MKIINKYGLPEILVKMAQRGNYPPKTERIGVTDLVGSPRIRQLKAKHWDELEMDVSDSLWMLLGSGIHLALEKIILPNSIHEMYIKTSIDDMEIAGKVDRYVQGTIEDWKVTSVWAFLLGEKVEWERQLNVYACLLKLAHKLPVTKLQINAILRDHMKSKTVDKDYPDKPFISVDVPLWDGLKTMQYISERIKAHKIDPAPLCTDEERWKKADSYAIMKIGRKTALRVFPTMQEVDAYMVAQRMTNNTAFPAQNPAQVQHVASGLQNIGSVIHRKGSYVRCQSFCAVRAMCPEGCK